MGLHLKKESAQSGKVIFQKVLETARGGFTLDSSGFTDGNTITAGTPVEFNESTRTAKVLKTAKVYESASGSPTQYKVEKDHHLVVGNTVGKASGSASYGITAIDTSNANYDLVTVATTLGAVSAGDVLFQTTGATGASAAAMMVTPNGLTYDAVEVSDDASLSVVLRGTVYARRIAVPTAVKTSLPLIVFSNSY